MGRYRQHYNHRRPHGTLGYRTLEEYAAFLTSPVASITAQTLEGEGRPKELEPAPMLS
jgi:hypothetical protein